MVSTIAFNTNINDDNICRSNTKDSSKGAEKHKHLQKQLIKAAGRAFMYL
jgi:hypothetical protein